MAYFVIGRFLTQKHVAAITLEEEIKMNKKMIKQKMLIAISSLYISIVLSACNTMRCRKKNVLISFQV